MGQVMACPVCVTDAPIEVAWSLFDPARLDEWWDATVRRVRPEGTLAPGQRIDAVAGPLGMFAVSLDVLEVDPGAHRLTRLQRRAEELHRSQRGQAANKRP